ncbi:origin recognition complex subunit 2 [Auricularia subglabra TFB-10046 SS5]|nr:origin recognition complex subunit 2 [Auricularia subglabra TFB-10046 SS5]
MSSASDSDSDDVHLSDVDIDGPAASRSKAAFAQPTSFDAYLTATATPAKTSNAVFSSLEPLSPDEYANLVQRARVAKPLDAVPFFPLYANSVDAGFNVFFYGYGSKLATLDKFARAVLARRGPVVVSRCFDPNFTLKIFLATLARATDAAAHTLEAVISALPRLPHAPLILLLHSLDKAPPKVRHATLRLATEENVQVIASLDHIRAPVLFTQRELSGWVWHDLTTLAPYDSELAHIDPLALRQHKDSGAAGAAAGQAIPTITETGAAHVLASVTARAKRVLKLLATNQLEADASTEPSAQGGMEYDGLLHACRADFIASNDTALRALLGEFTDHGLVRIENDILWIPLRKDVLQRVIDKMGSIN